MFGCGIGDDIRPQRQRPLEHRGRKDIINHHARASLFGKFAHGFNIHQVQHRVGRAFQKHRIGRLFQGVFPLVQVMAIYKGSLHAKARQNVITNVIAGTEQRAGRDQPLTLAQKTGQRMKDSGHPTGRRAASFCAFQQRQALFKHANGGIGIAGIHEIGGFALKRGFCLFRIIIDIARGQKQTFTGLPKISALQAAPHQFRLLAIPPSRTDFRFSAIHHDLFQSK